MVAHLLPKELWAKTYRQQNLKDLLELVLHSKDLSGSLAEATEHSHRQIKNARG
jgi:hypothetical protein